MCAEDGDSLDMALALARNQGLLVGPSSGAAIICACEMGCRPEMAGKRIVAICPSSAVRYMQHPLFKTLRDEANEVLCAAEAEAKPVPVMTPEHIIGTLPKFAKRATLSRQTFDIIEGVILNLVRDILNSPMLQAHDLMIDHGATSLTAMMILGKVRGAVLHEVEAKGLVVPAAEMSSLSDLHGMKVAIMKERLWGSVHEP